MRKAEVQNVSNKHKFLFGRSAFGSFTHRRGVESLANKFMKTTKGIEDRINSGENREI